MEPAGDRVGHGELAEAAHHHPGDQRAQDIGEDGAERASLADGVAGGDEQARTDDAAEGDHHQVALFHGPLEAGGGGGICRGACGGGGGV